MTDIEQATLTIMHLEKQLEEAKKELAILEEEAANPPTSDLKVGDIVSLIYDGERAKGILTGTDIEGDWRYMMIKKAEDGSWSYFSGDHSPLSPAS